MCLHVLYSNGLDWSPCWLVCGLYCRREDALSQKNSEPDEANSDSQRLSTVEEGSVVTPRRAAGHSHGQRDERSARWSLTSSTSFDRSLGEVKALVDATEATSARMLQNRLATTSSECWRNQLIRVANKTTSTTVVVVILHGTSFNCDKRRNQ